MKNLKKLAFVAFAIVSTQFYAQTKTGAVTYEMTMPDNEEMAAMGTNTIKGRLEVHGKNKDITSIAKVKKVGSEIEIKTDFIVNVSDFDIEIPSIVSKKVSKKVTLNCNFLLK